MFLLEDMFSYQNMDVVSAQFYEGAKTCDGPTIKDELSEKAFELSSLGKHSSNNSHDEEND